MPGLLIPAVRTPTAVLARRKDLIKFQKSTGLKFKRLDLLDLAFCHRSYVNETHECIDSNERLEFLGDSVLGLVVAEYLFRQLPNKPEGNLAKIKAHVVSENSLSEIALNLGIDTIVRVGRGEELSGGREKKSLLADTFEAVIGAWYLDSGYSKASKFIIRHLKKSISIVIADKHKKDYKSLLQEFSHKNFHCFPKYDLEKKTGPDHMKTFWIKVVIDGIEYGPGTGKTKKSAEQNAAQIAWQTLNPDSFIN